MSNSSDRFYQLQFNNRAVLQGDVGSLLKIDGLVVGGGGASAILLLPTSSASLTINSSSTGEVIEAPVYKLTTEEWSDFLQRSDVPELLMPDKAFHRKARFEISGAVQQKIWVADDFKCVYCNKKMGDVQLTIDHFLPLELGGENNQSNYLSACRKCNKDKGSQDPKKWCNPQQFLELQHYLKNRVIQYIK